MNFDLTEEQQRIRDTLASFAEREIKPHSGAWDKHQSFPRQVVEQLGELGFLGVAYPERWGGGGADTLSQVLVVEGLSRYDASVGLTCAAHMSLGTGHIAMFASDENRDRLVPELLRANKLAAWCLTEPGSGSDAGALKTRATRVGDGYALTGNKMFITNGTVGDVYVVMAVTDPGAGRSGVSAFIVERGAAGLSNGRKIEKLGLRASDTAEVVLDNVIVPARNLIGEPGDGYRQALKVLEGGRIGIAGFAAGIARGALEEATAYARHRTQFGKPIADFQAIQWIVVLEDLGNSRLLENRFPGTLGLAGSAINAFVGIDVELVGKFFLVGADVFIDAINGTHADASGVNAVAAKAGNRPRHGWQSPLKSTLKSISNSN